MSYNNYRKDYDNLNNWLSRVPNYEPRDTDDTRQVETKLKNQRVSDEQPGDPHWDTRIYWRRPTVELENHSRQVLCLLPCRTCSLISQERSLT